MDVNFFLICLWICTVYRTGRAISLGEPERNQLFESEPHPYTISFFTFPKGTQLFKSKVTTKRNNEEYPGQESEKPISSKKVKSKKFNSTKTLLSKKNNTKLDSKKENNITEPDVSDPTKLLKTNITRPFVQVYEKPNVLDKAGKTPEVGPEKGHQKVEPWKLGSTHNKIQLKAHQKDETDERYQEGSINHPSHTMYPMCHHCSSNSSYEECVNSKTLAKCRNGLNNICFTKSFRSASRGMIYEMGCSNHVQCKKAKSKPCKGNTRRCFVCCQYDGCNAMPHHNLHTTDNKDETELSYLNEAAIYSSSKWLMGVIVFLQALTWL